MEILPYHKKVNAAAVKHNCVFTSRHFTSMRFRYQKHLFSILPMISVTNTHNTFVSHENIRVRKLYRNENAGAAGTIVRADDSQETGARVVLEWKHT